MMLSPRDLRVLRFVDRFGVTTSSHIQAAEFDDLSSKTNVYRTLRRLADDQKLLRKMERRPIGGWKHGSGQWIYTLSTKGYRLLGAEPRKGGQGIVEHELAIADVFTAAKLAHKHGEIVVHRISVAPEVRLNLPQKTVIPDLYIELTINDIGATGRLFLEVDTGTELRNLTTIEEKLQNYYELATQANQSFPGVLFLATWEYNLPALERKIANARVPALFKVSTVASFPQVLTSIM